jgi:adenylosuccinate synthase
MDKAFAVVGLCYGDEGKGSIVDYLTWKHNQQHSALVVRFNGGAQTAHNVVLPDGRHHTFSQFGSGSLQGAATLLTKHVIVNPRAMIREWMELKDKIGPDAYPMPYVDMGCLLTTHFQIALNRVQIRVAGGHNSCGMGIGQTRQDNLEYGDKVLFVNDLFTEERTKKKLRFLQEACRGEALARLNSGTVPEEFSVLDVDDDELNEMVWMLRKWFRHQIYPVRDGMIKKLLDQTSLVIFEGAQGLMLDETYGETGYNTWTNTTLENMYNVFRNCGYPDNGGIRIGVMRSYMTRHGDGPLFGEKNWTFEEPYNPDWGFAGKFRHGVLDLQKILAFLKICPVDGLAVNHLDHTYEAHPVRLVDGEVTCVSKMDFIDVIERELGLPVVIVGVGSTYKDKSDGFHKLTRKKGEMLCEK